MKIKHLIILLILAFTAHSVSNIAEARDMQRIDDITTILKSFKNYRFGKVNVYEVISKDELKEFYKVRFATKKGETAASDTCLSTYNSYEPDVKNIFESQVRDGNTLDQLRDELIENGYRRYAGKSLDCIYNYLVSKFRTQDAQKDLRVFVITTVPEPGKSIPDTIIGAIFVEVKFDELSSPIEDMLAYVDENYIFSYDALKYEPLDESKYGQNNLYSLFDSYFIQKNMRDKTLEARGLFGSKIFNTQPGIGSSVLSSDGITSADIQTFIRISDGQPINYYKSHEIIASFDLIRWTKYQDPIYKVVNELIVDSTGAPKVDSLGVPTNETYEKRVLDIENPTNKQLPLYGFELRYGMEEINFPSLWSERLTLSALWQSVKVGYILPTSGWASLGKDVFQQDRKLTYSKSGGFAASINIPVPVIKQSGIFDASFSFLFGDAKECSWKNRDLNPETFKENDKDLDYLIRSAGQAHYTIGINVDKNYWIRFGIGATFYNVESWMNKLVLVDEISGETKIDFKKKSSETIGGISGRLDFMVNNISTPIGARIQYFDNAISTHAWLLVPIIDQSLSLRFDIQGYAVAFRSEPKAWENNNVLIPSLRLIYVY